VIPRHGTLSAQSSDPHSATGICNTFHTLVLESMHSAWADSFSVDTFLQRHIFLSCRPSEYRANVCPLLIWGRAATAGDGRPAPEARGAAPVHCFALGAHMGFEMKLLKREPVLILFCLTTLGILLLSIDPFPVGLLSILHLAN